jgi:hypothetical protein
MGRAGGKSLIYFKNRELSRSPKRDMRLYSLSMGIWFEISVIF